MDYKDTINLPKTSFPMKANLVKREPEILKKWEEMDLYRKFLKKNEGRTPFTLHDGPPYANGHIHMGTALNKVLKDIIIKSKNMEGYYTPYVPGWDCHGLPIEFQVEKELGGKKEEFGVAEVRKRCRKFAENFINIQRNEFKRLGVLGDWENPYITMDYLYEADIVREFARFVEEGYVYIGNKPVYWCPRCETALAEAEVEYEERTSPSIYVEFPFRDDPGERVPELKGKDVSVVIWTTTPWTIPANLAVCLHPNHSYAAYEIEGKVYIAAERLLPILIEELGWEEGKTIARFEGKTLEGLKLKHPIYDRDSLIILGEHVTLDAGTGCVHTAPGHGAEDYEVGLKYNLEIYAPVDEKGRFTKDVGFFSGMGVFEANPEVEKKLLELGKLLKSGKITHSYPYCWRCKGPVIFRATRQWFISIEKNKLRERLLEAIEKEVTWIPKWGMNRIYSMMKERPDWCISRQRYWGVPIVAFHCKNCGKTHLNKELCEHVARVFEEKGADAWFTMKEEELLPEGYTCQCGSRELKKEGDILDVWFDSGVSFSAVLIRRNMPFPADMYLEGSDQHRGWFHSSLICSVATRNTPPYRNVLTHGFVVDGKGRKMSKSLGNVIYPEDLVGKYGAEILRLWVASEDYRDDIRISQEIIERNVEVYRRIRNTIRFLLGNLYDFNPKEDTIKRNDMLEIDRWALARLEALKRRVKKAYNSYRFHVVYHATHTFCTVDMSSLYLDILKDRLYIYPSKSLERRSAQTALYEILRTLLLLLSPILSFTAEEAWNYLPGEKKESIFLEHFPEDNDDLLDEELTERWDVLMDVREKVTKELEVARKEKLIGHSLDAKVVLTLPDDTFDTFSHWSEEELSYYFIVSQVEVKKGKDLAVEVKKAEGSRCERCWRYGETDERGLCKRCQAIMDTLRKEHS